LQAALEQYLVGDKFQVKVPETSQRICNGSMVGDVHKVQNFAASRAPADYHFPVLPNGLLDSWVCGKATPALQTRLSLKNAAEKSVRLCDALHR
jgi:hypothetical protein